MDPRQDPDPRRETVSARPHDPPGAEPPRPEDDLPKERIRQFRLLRRLGRGGMGSVYLAADENLDRRVALKILHARHRLQGDAKVRLLREARILSQLEHPNICRIFDYVEEDGADCLVLELIDGKSLREIVRDGLEPARAMVIAERVADVLVAAHSRGVVHRDLKPENVMLTEQGEVKVLDFGIARSVKGESPPPEPAAAEASDTAATLAQFRTAAGQITGTAGYMSPEQSRGADVSPASDMYSFGLLLQELFTGKAPYDPQPTPLALLLKVSKAETRPVAGVDPDLAALIERLKSLAPAARPTAIDTAERLRAIRDKPRHRRRRRLRAAAVAFLALVAAVMTVLAVRIASERDRANEATVRARNEAERANAERAAAEEVSAFLIELFEASDPFRPDSEVSRDTPAVELLERGSERIEHLETPLTQARLMMTMAEVYRRLGLPEKAGPLFEQALSIRRHENADPLDVAISAEQLARWKLNDGDYPGAENLLQEALAIQQEAIEDGALDPQALPLGDTLKGLGLLHWYRGEAATAIPNMEGAAEIYRVHGEELALANQLNNLGFAFLQLTAFDEAEAAFASALEIRRRRLSADHPAIADTLNGLGVAYSQARRYDEALAALQRSLEIRRRALGEHHPRVGWSLSSVGSVLVDAGRFREARGPLEEASALIDDPRFRASCLLQLGRTYAALERMDDAEASFLDALHIWDELEQAEPGSSALIELATLYTDGGRHREAEEVLVRIEPSLAARIARAHLDVARGRFGAARQALVAVRGILEGQSPRPPGSELDLAWALDGLARCAEAEGRSAEAEELYRQALALRGETLGSEHPLLADTLRALAVNLAGRGQIDEARHYFSRALHLRGLSFPPEHPDLLEIEADLAQLSSP